MRTLFSIFLTLAPLASACSGDRLPPVFLSHFYVTLDQASYDALRSSPELAALSKVAETHVAAGSRKWTGFYIYGRQTYMEFFGAVAAPEGMRLGDAGLGLAVEEVAGVGTIASRLRTVFGGRVKVEPAHRTTAAGVIPWFTAASVENPKVEGLNTWFMETDPGYLAAMHPGSRIERPLGREEDLAWRFIPDRPLDNVVGLTAALNSSDMAQLAAELELAGWAVRRGSGGFVAVGPDAKITVVVAGARAGLQQAELRLRH